MGLVSGISFLVWDESTSILELLTALQELLLLYLEGAP